MTETVTESGPDVFVVTPIRPSDSWRSVRCGCECLKRWEARSGDAV